MLAAITLFLQAVPCIPAPTGSRELLESIGKTDDRWPSGDTIRFSAFSSFDTQGWVVEVNRPTIRTQQPVVEVLLVKHEPNCNRNSVVTRWRAPLLADEAEALFTDIEALRARVTASRNDEIVVDGTAFALAVNGPGGVSRIRLSPAADGPSGALSERIRLLAARIAGAAVPPGAQWSTTGRD